MATESIGTLIPTAIPGYSDAADIQAALRAYHYGSYSYDPANTSPSSLVSPSMAKTIYDIQQDIVVLENRPSSGGDVSTTAPVPGDFTPPEIPNGYIWVDQDGSLGGQPVSATSVFTNTPPTSSLSTGVIWVDKDPTTITENPFIPSAIINVKGDLVVGTANDTASVLTPAATNGYILSINSSTTSGLEWIANEVGDITAVTAGTGISVTNSTGPIPSVAVDTTVVATTDNILTLSNKTISATNNTITNISVTSGISGLGTGVATFLSTPSSTNLASAVTDETGSGPLVFGTSPTLTTPKIYLGYTAKTDNYTVTNGDQGYLISMNAATPKTFSIPTDATYNFEIGTQISFVWITGAGQPTISAVTPATTTILSNAAITTAPKLRMVNSAATAVKILANTWLIIGDLT